MGWAERCSLENYHATSLLGLSPRLEWGTVVDLQQFFGLHGAFPYLPQGSERKGWWEEAQPTNMSLLCFPSLATVVTSWSLPVLMMPTWGLSLGTDFCAGFSPTPFPSSCLMTNTDFPFPLSHSFAFYQEGDNECTAIDFQGISAPRDRESIIWIRNTFLSLIN